MPIYTFECVDCDRPMEIVMPMSNVVSVGDTIASEHCECGGKLRRTIVDVNSMNKENHRWSKNLGLNPVQMNDPATMKRYRQFHPDATLDKRGRLLIKSRADKLKRLNEHNKMTGQKLVETD